MGKKYQRKEFLKMALLTRMAFIAKPLSFMARGIATSGSPTGNENVTYFKKGDEQYEVLRKGFNKRINKSPLVIALCKNEAGVAEAIRYAVQANLPVAIKSGGHCMEGFSCNDGGMVINLSLLNNIEWINKDMIKLDPAAPSRICMMRYFLKEK